MLASKRKNLKLRLEGPSTQAISNNLPLRAPSAHKSFKSVPYSTTAATLRPPTPPEIRAASSVYSQPSYPTSSPPHHPTYFEGNKHVFEIPSPKSWTGSFSDDDGTSLTASFAPPLPPPPARAAPTYPPSSFPSYSQPLYRNASQTAAARAIFSSQRAATTPSQDVYRVLANPAAHPLKTHTRSTPYSAVVFPPLHSTKGHMNCEGRYLRIGTLRGPTPSQMAWVDGVMTAALEKSRDRMENGGKRGAEKAGREVEKGLKEVRRWLKEQKRETVEYTIEYVRWRYDVTI